jgi:hypothetical protein
LADDDGHREPDASGDAERDTISGGDTSVAIPNPYGKSNGVATSHRHPDHYTDAITAGHSDAYHIAHREAGDEHTRAGSNTGR